MDLTVLVEKLTTAQASVQVKDGELTAANAQVANLSATVATLTAENTTLKASNDVTKVTSLTAENVTLKASADAALGYVRAEANRLAIAAGLSAPAEDADLDALKASIETSRSKLGNILPINGVAQPQGGTVVQASNDGHLATFKTR